MKNYGSKGNCQQKLRGVHGRGIRWVMVCAAMVAGGLIASQAAAQGVLSFSPTSMNFGSVNDGTTKTLLMKIINTGRASVTISKETVSGSAFIVSGLTTPVTIAVGAYALVTLKFAPQTPGTFSGYLAITSNASNSSFRYAMTGTGVTAALTATPSGASFGSVPLGITNSQTVQLNNTGASSVTISSTSVTGKGFALRGITAPLVVGAGRTVSATLSFAPTVTGYVAGSVAIVSNASDETLTMTVSGTGVADTRTITETPTSLSFGNENVGASNTLPVTLKNTGNSTVTLSGITISGTGITTTGGTSGTTIAPGQSTTVDVTFGPKVAGLVSGSVKVASNATNSPATIVVSGDGVASTTHSVTLNWEASTSTGIAGYYVYRAVGTGGYSTLVTSPVSGLKFTDTGVTTGTTYRYVVTAADTAGAESPYSAAVTVTVP
jgi:hypothetical protein